MMDEMSCPGSPGRPEGGRTMRRISAAKVKKTLEKHAPRINWPSPITIHKCRMIDEIEKELGL